MLIRQKPHHLILIQVSVTRVTFIFIIVNIKCTGVTTARCICHNLPPVISFLFKNRYQLQVSSFKTGSILVHSFFFFSHRLRPVDNQDSDRNQHQCDQVFHSEYISLTQNDRGKDHPEYRIRKSED